MSALPSINPQYQSEMGKVSALTNPLDLPLPQVAESEMLVLGTAMYTRDHLPSIIDALLPDEFGYESHQIIFQAIKEVYLSGQLVCPISVADKIEAIDHGMLMQVGGRARLDEMAMAIALPEATNWHIDKVKDASKRRKTIYALYNALSKAYDPTEADYLGCMQSAILELTTGTTPQTDYDPGKDFDNALVAALNKLTNPSRVAGVSSGFASLDDIAGGMAPGELHILAARPSMGKSALAAQIALNVASHTGSPVIIFSLEMERTSVIQRFLSAQAEVCLSTKPHNEQDLDAKKVRLDHAYEKLRGLPIWVVDNERPTLATLQAKIHRLQAKTGAPPALVVVDYLQLMEGSGRENRNQEVSELSRGLKQIATRNGLPVLALSQLSRAVESRQDKRPMLSDLRESGAIEQDADVVMFLYRDEYYNKQSERTGVAEVVVGKNRRGATGTVELHFRGAITKFSEPITHYGGHH
jgi:replicative DNA helicase